MARRGREAFNVQDDRPCVTLVDPRADPLSSVPPAEDPRTVSGVHATAPRPSGDVELAVMSIELDDTREALDRALARANAAERENAELRVRVETAERARAGCEERAANAAQLIEALRSIVSLDARHCGREDRPTSIPGPIDVEALMRAANHL